MLKNTERDKSCPLGIEPCTFRIASQTPSSHQHIPPSPSPSRLLCCRCTTVAVTWYFVLLLLVDVAGEGVAEGDGGEEHLDADDEVLPARRHRAGAHLVAVDEPRVGDHATPLQEGQHHAWREEGVSRYREPLFRSSRRGFYPDRCGYLLGLVVERAGVFRHEMPACGLSAGNRVGTQNLLAGSQTSLSP